MANVRFGSKAGHVQCKRHVRFYPKSGHVQCTIASAEVPKLMPEVSSFEPRLALDGGAEGFDAYQLIIAASPRLVTAGGFMAVEAGEGQVTEITRIFAAAGLSPRPPRKDLGGIDRVVTAGN